MPALRQSVSRGLAGSILVLAAACRETTQPEARMLAPQDSAGVSASAGKKPPAKPSTLRLSGNTSYSVSLAWDAPADASSVVSYRVRDNWGREITVAGTATSVTWKYPAHPPLQPGSTYSFTLYALDAAGNTSAGSNTVSVALPLDKQAPTVPVISVTSVGTRHISLAWSSTDDSPFISYKATKDGVQISSGWISDTSRTFTLLQPGTTYTFTVQARDSYVNVSSGNVSAASAPFSVMTKANDGSDVTPPTSPAPVAAVLYGDGSTEMEVSWTASTDAVTPRNVIIYEVYVNGTLENTAIGKTQTNAYGVPGENVITVIAIDEAGNRSVAGKTTIFISS